MSTTCEPLEYWLENAHDLLQEVSADGQFLYMNPAWRDALGYSEEEAKCLSLFDVIHPESRSHCEATFHDIVAGKEIDKIEAVFVARDGRAISVEGLCHCRFDENGPVSIQGIFRDVTQRKQLEEQLRQSQKMEALGLLASSVSHDFGNLLMAISGTVEWMNSQPESQDRLTRGLAQLDESVQTALALTEQLRTFSRGGSGKTVVLDLNATVTKTIDMLERLLGGGIKIETYLAAEPSRVRVGESHIEQIVMNLTVNAKDAMDGKGTIRLETLNGFGTDEATTACSDDSTERQVILRVRDTGCGMDAETRQRIFEPFFTTKRIGQGSGLGLSTVFGIVKQAGGTITVDSAVDQGSCFTIHLPAADPELLD